MPPAAFSLQFWVARHRHIPSLWSCVPAGQVVLVAVLWFSTGGEVVYVVVVPEGAIVPAGTVAVVVIGGAVVEDSVVVVVGGTPEEQALKPIDAIIARAKAPFFTSFMVVPPFLYQLRSESAV